MRPAPQGALATITLAPNQNPTGVAVDPEGNLVYVASHDTNSVTNMVTVIDGATNAIVNSFGVGQGPLGVAVYRGYYELPRPHGPHTFRTVNRVFVACSGDHTLWVLDFDPGTIDQPPPLDLGAGTQPRYVAVDGQTGRVYVTSYTTGTVVVIDGRANSLLTTFTVPGAPPHPLAKPHGVAVNSETTRIWVGNTDGTVVVVDGSKGTYSSGAQVFLGTLVGPEGLAVNPKTGLVYVGDDGGNRVWVVGGGKARIIKVAAPTRGVAVNPQTKRIYAVESSCNRVAVIDGATSKVVGTISVGPNPLELAVNPRTNRVYVSNFGSNTVSVVAG
jgi:YVTN family beta-propeller protein